MNLKLKKILFNIFGKSIRTTRVYRIIVIFSLLFAIYYTIYNLFAIFAKQHIIDYLNNSTSVDLLYFYKQNLIFFFSNTTIMYLLCFIVGVGMILSSIMLYKGFKWGLLLYTITKIMQVFIPFTFMGIRILSIGDIMFILLFILYYYIYSFSHQVNSDELNKNPIKIENNK